MNELTNAERVAVALFKWKRHAEEMEHDSYEHFRIWSDGKPWCSVNGMPDFTNERLAPYWCDRMQRELAALIRNGQEMYALALTHIVKSTEDPDWLALTKMQKVSWSACLHATPAQRLEAAVRVLDEVGL